jgi:Type IV secretion system pilin
MNYFINSALAASVNITTTLPGPNGASAGVGGFVANFYTFALLISGILAFGAIVWGGVRYAAGRGNPSSESEGKSWITNALLGMLLLAGAYIILNTINPNILNLQLPAMPTLASPQAVNNGTGGANQCGTSCFDNSDCTCAGQTCVGVNDNGVGFATPGTCQ